MKWYHLNWTIKWDKKKSVYDMVMGVLVVHAIMSQFALWWQHYLYNSIWFLYLVHLTTPGNTSLFLKYRISPVFKWMAAVKEYWKRFKSIYFFLEVGSHVNNIFWKKIFLKPVSTLILKCSDQHQGYVNSHGRLQANASKWRMIRSGFLECRL